MIAKLLKPMEGAQGVLPIGAELNHPDAYRLVQLGIAEAGDDECQEKLAELAAAVAAKHERRNALHPPRPKPVAQEKPSTTPRVKPSKEPIEKQQP